MNEEPETHRITRLLSDVAGGDCEAREPLIIAVYHQLGYAHMAGGRNLQGGTP